MKDSKYCHTMSCYWGYRHEILGLILLVIATFLTLVTANSFGIVAMFLVGLVLCCYRHICCHLSHSNGQCHTSDVASAKEKPPVKKAVAKVKK